MSLKCRLDSEVSYALNALSILSAGVGAPPDFEFFLQVCDDLFDELLDLLEEVVFGTEEEQERKSAKKERVQRNGQASNKSKGRRRGHLEMVRAAKADESEMREWRRRKKSRSLSESSRQPEDVQQHLERRNSLPSTARQGGEPEDTSNPAEKADEPVESDENSDGQHPDAEQEEGQGFWHEERVHRTKERNSTVALTILIIIRNFSMMSCNVGYLNSQPHFFELMARLTQCGDWFDLGSDDSDSQATAKYEDRNETPFTYAEALRVRKDILVILASISGEQTRLEGLSDHVVSNLFDMIVSFIVDASDIQEIEGNVFPDAPPGKGQLKVPAHADTALEAFSRLAQPDANRQVLARVIDADALYNFAIELIRLLPVADEDFEMFRTENRLAFTERIAMSLFNIAFLSPQEVKRRLREAPGMTSVLFRALRRLAKQAPDFNKSPFVVLISRLTETLKLINDSLDVFAAPDLLGMGVFSGSTNTSAMRLGRGSAEHASGILIDHEDEVLEVLRYRIEPSTAAELEALCAF